MGPRVGLDRRGKSRPLPGFDPRTVQLVVSPYTDYAMRPTQQSRALACSPDTTPAYPHLTFNLQQPKNETTNVVINNIVVSS